MPIGMLSTWVAQPPCDDALIVTWYCTETNKTVERDCTSLTPDEFAAAQAAAVEELRTPIVFTSLAHDDARCKTGRENMCNECRMIADADTCEYCGKTIPSNTRCCEAPNE